MATTAVVDVSVSYSGDEVGASGSNTVRKTSTNTNAVATGGAYTSLSNGANTITVPTGYSVTGVVIIPPAGNTTSLTLKGNSGDTGVRLHNTIATALALDSSVTSFIVTAGAALTIRLAWF